MTPKSATSITERSTVPSRVDWQDREHKRRQQGPKTDLQAELFDALNEYARSHGVWIISPRGARDVMVEAPAGSNVAQDLAAMGFKVSPAGSGSRLVPGATAENIESNRYKAPRVVLHPGEIATDLFEIILPRT